MYVYLQPKYVDKFKCDGTICPANCCKRHWKISIDAETYQKYLRLETSAHELTRHIEQVDDEYFIRQEDGTCPFLRENLCSIQLECGEENLSQICRGYPRQLYRFGRLIERSLTLTCPIAAQLVLNSEQRMEFETREIELPTWARRRIFVNEPIVPQELLPYAVEIQLTAISILQEKRLNIDARLIVLGFYLRQVEEVYLRGDFETIFTLNKIYTAEEFFVGQVPLLVDSVNFQPKEFVAFVSSVLEKIREGTAAKFIRQVDLEVTPKVRRKFLKRYTSTLENYLVNEFFGGAYPFKIYGTLQHNYAIFVTNFKLLEVTALSLYAKKSARQIFEMIVELAVDLNHNPTFSAAITDAVKDFADITVLMKKLFRKD